MDFTVQIDELSPAVPLPVNPLPNVIVAVLVDIAPVAVVQIIFELAFVDNLIDLFANALDTTIEANLADDEAVVLRSAEG